MKILMLPGDGIGPEITAATRQVLEAASRRFNLSLQFVDDVVGHESMRLYGATVRPEILDRARAADGLILGPCATADFKDEARGAINPSKYLRKNLDLFANVRPARTYEGIPARVGNFDLVVVRENTEGFYTDRNMEQGNGEILVTPDVAISLRRITRHCCDRIAREAFKLASLRSKKVALVHKANIFKIADGLFIDCCMAVAAEFPEVAVESLLIDAMTAHVVRAAHRFDVIVTTNMFGDILSDLTAELSGSLGLGGALNAGSNHAMGQAAHGSAPDIAGRDLANPIALILSAAMLLDWHGSRSKSGPLRAAAAAIHQAVGSAVAAHETTADIGGKLGTRQTGKALAERILQA